MFVESEAGFMLNKLPSYLLPWSVSGGDGRIAGKALQIEQGNVRKLIANKIGLTLFPLSPPCLTKGGGKRAAGLSDELVQFPAWPVDMQ